MKYGKNPICMSAGLIIEDHDLDAPEVRKVLNGNSDFCDVQGVAKYFQNWLFFLSSSLASSNTVLFGRAFED